MLVDWTQYVGQNVLVKNKSGSNRQSRKACVNAINGNDVQFRWLEKNTLGWRDGRYMELVEVLPD